MSNLVVWELVGPLLLELLVARGELEEARHLERERHRHPLVDAAEATLNRLLSPRGGLTCAELEVELREAMRRDPRGLRAVLSSVVDRYLAMKRTLRGRERLAWFS